jgi:hypothetical protein
MMPTCIALTALTGRIRMDELAAVAAVLQTQVTRDFVPEWGVDAVVAAVSFESIPAGYIPIIVQDTLEAEGTNGFHRTRADDTPFVVLPYGPTWPLAASHELLRMLANPTGSARRPGLSCMPGQGIVEYLIDVCSPCQDISAAYAIDGITVSDFCTPYFFGARGHAGSFNDAVAKAFVPAAGGVVTWLADDGLLYQSRADQQGKVLVHGGFSPANRGRMLLRELVDILVPDRLTRLVNATLTGHLLDAEQNARRARLANTARFRDDIAWRFGYASVEPSPDRLTDAAPVQPMSQREARRQKPYIASGAKSGQHRQREDLDTTLRTAS